jgi:AcrR family transcriptional regulator
MDPDLPLILLGPRITLDNLRDFVDCLFKLMASDTRDRILSVAARLFEAGGFEGTAVAAILREAGVNSGSLYHFFSGKEELLVAVLEKYVATLEPALLGAADRAADDPLEKVFALVELYRGRLLVSGFERGCPVGDLSLEIGSRVPEARGLVDAYFRAWTERTAGWLDDPDTRLRRDVDREALAVHVLSTLQGAIMQARAARSIDPFDDSMSQLRLLLSLLGEDSEVLPVGASAPGRRLVRANTREAESPGTPAVEVGAGSGRIRGDGEAIDGLGSDEDAWWRAW